MARLPYYFYDINAIMPNGRQRWFDEFADEAPHIIQPSKDLNLDYQRRKTERNQAYSKWQAAFFGRGKNGEFEPYFKAKNIIFQAIRVLSFKHSEKSSKDWWEDYQDALFRVFVSPETVYCPETGEHKQWYLLCPEDCYLVNCREAERANRMPPVRDYDGREKYLSAYPMLRCARFIPVECCAHLRHEGHIKIDGEYEPPAGL